MSLRRSIAAALVVVTVPLLSSCAGNFNAQTDQPYNPAAGTDDRSGSVDVLNALIVSGTDGSGTVVASLVNNDQTHADRLTNVAGAGRDAGLSVTPGGSTTIAAGGMLNLATQSHITARGTRVVPGNFVEITFSFDRGAAITLGVPVVSAKNPDYAGIKVP